MTMTCRELEDLIDAHLDETLAKTERDSLLMHLKACGACGRYARDYVRAIALARAAYREDGVRPPAESDANMDWLVEAVQRALNRGGSKP